MKERLKELRIFLNLSQAKFAEKIGVSHTAIHCIESGKNNGSPTLYTAICMKFNVNENWLIHGEGEMFNETVNVSDFAFMPKELVKATLSEEDKEFITKYLLLPPYIRRGFNDFWREFGQMNP